MKVCIASAHVKCDRQRLWRELQWQFISDNSEWDFEYYVIANGISPRPFEWATGVAHIKEKTSHSTCIETIRQIFDRSEADYCLLLDSDCWPVRIGWEDLLAEWIQDYYLAAPVRTENLDIFAHPSAVFFKRENLEYLDFGFARNPNLLGENVSDVGGALGIDGVYPLLKTNYISPHPVYASVYGDLFYHHCAGSRGAGVRCAKYYRHLITLPQQRKIYNKVTSQLKQRPRQFIDSLRGVKSRVTNSAVK